MSATPHLIPLLALVGIVAALIGCIAGYLMRSKSSHTETHTETHTHNGAAVSPDDPAVAEIHEAFDKATAAFAKMESALKARAAAARKKP